jgi:hypothetical protein
MAQERSEKDKHRTVLALVEMLHGMTLAEAHHALDQAKHLIGVSHHVDVHGAGFAHNVRAYNEAYQDDWRPTVDKT